MSISKNKKCPRHRANDTISCSAKALNDGLNKLAKASFKMNDPVSHPSHYQSKNGLEVIDVINAFTDDLEGMEAVCTANILKYVCRWKKKNGAEDLKKAIWYAEYLVNYIQQSEKENKEETNNE